MAQLKGGVLGFGSVGQNLTRYINQQRTDAAQIVAACDVAQPQLDLAAGTYGLAATPNAHELMAMNLDFVLVVSSNHAHADQVVMAAEAGKHIFCEKPIALDLAEIDRALEAVDKAGVKLQIGFNRRFDPNFKAARDMVAAGKIGDPHIVRITSRDPAPPPIEYIKVSGGIFLDMTIHDFDMARFLINSEVEEIYAAGAVLVDPAIGEAGDIDTALITLRYANGAIGTIDNSRRAVYGYDQRVEVFGSEGGVVVSNNTPHKAVYSNAQGVQSAQPLYFFLERYMDAYVVEMQAFIEAVQQDTSPIVTGIDGRIPVTMGLAAWKSYKENRPVKLSEIN